MRVAVIAGGVGAARFLEGLVSVVPPRDVTVIVNTGDDAEMYGLRVCPDVDIVTYHLAGLADTARGWGLLHDTFHVVEGLRRLGEDAWFNLGDHDLATCLHRTLALRAGRALHEVTAATCAALGVEARVLPMTDDAVATRLLTDAGTLPFQEYFVHRRTEPEVRAVEYAGADRARPAPGALEALADADRVCIAPSNPVLSIAPVLAVPGYRDALQAALSAGQAGGARVVAVSPIIAGQAVKGPAVRLLASLGYEPTALGVARIYQGLCGTFVLDRADAALAPEVERLGMRVVVTDTLMRGRFEKARLAAAALGLE